MGIDGRAIAESILNTLASEVESLKQKGVTPKLAVILVGDNPASMSYIKQKQIAAEKIGALVHVENLPASVTSQKLNNIIQQYNADGTTHGLIIQRPLPSLLSDTSMYRYIDTKKDVDGFLLNSPYTVPVAEAVFEILKNCKSQITSASWRTNARQKTFSDWVKSKFIVVIGRGETAGKPIAQALIKLGCTITVIHSQTPHPDDVIRTGDIIISCVGKDNVVRRDNVKQGAILIGVGIRRNSDGKLHGDFDEEEMKDIVSCYTPTPGGVGPVNVACLMQNLVKATHKS